MDRRTVLAAMAGGITAGLAGCVGGNVAGQPALEVDRTEGDDTACREVPLIDESFRLAARLQPIGDAGLVWPVELETGNALKIAIYWWGERNRVMRLPDITITEPDGEQLLALSRYSSNIHTIEVQSTGAHEIEIVNNHLSEGGRWRIEITWYADPACA